MCQQTHRRGLTRSEVVTCSVALIILGVIIVGIFGPYQRSRLNARFLKDAAQLNEIYKSLVVFSREFDGSFPLPSLIVGPDANGNEDFTLNHSANIYSSLVAKHYATPELLISPLEVSGHVTEANYDYTAYDPLNGSYWDPSFVMRIDDPTKGANGSYAHVVAVGDRVAIFNTPALSEAAIVMGTRGPDVTNLDPIDYPRSPAMQILKPYDQWVGNIAVADGHVETLTGFEYSARGCWDPDLRVLTPDNIFTADLDHPKGAADAFIAIYSAASEFTVNDIYDPLDD